MIAEAVAGVAVVFKGKSKTAKLPKDLATYVKSLGSKSGHVATKGDQGWTFTGEAAAELRKVGKFWVVIETPSSGPDGRFITILTEAWK